MKSSKLDYQEERDRELVRVFLSNLGGGNSVDDAVRAAIVSPCSRYWISPENAYKRISAYRRGKEYSKKGTRRGRMEIILSIMEKCAGDYSARKVEEVVFSKAPKFFLTFETAKRYIYYEIKKRRQCLKNKFGKS